MLKNVDANPIVSGMEEERCLPEWCGSGYDDWFAYHEIGQGEVIRSWGKPGRGVTELGRDRLEISSSRSEKQVGEYFRSWLRLLL